MFFWSFNLIKGSFTTSQFPRLAKFHHIMKKILTPGKVFPANTRRTTHWPCRDMGILGMHANSYVNSCVKAGIWCLDELKFQLRLQRAVAVIASKSVGPLNLVISGLYCRSKLSRLLVHQDSSSRQPAIESSFSPLKISRNVQVILICQRGKIKVIRYS